MDRFRKFVDPFVISLQRTNDTDAPGRNCPVHYRYSASTLDRAPELYADALYIVGGLYGNVPALERVLQMPSTERGMTQLVFNGDFNWFNVDPESFARINEAVLQHPALRGNVETELATDDDAPGCGCAYPDWVPDDVVQRSNQIMRILRSAARNFVALRGRLAALPMHRVAQVGNVKIAVVHGDAESLAGWSFAYEKLSSSADDTKLKKCFEAAGAPLIASTHTCLPVVKCVALPDGPGAIVNNGSAGMPNFKGTSYGLVTRIATYPAPRHASCFGVRVRGLYVDLIKVEYDQTRWLQLFEKNWPRASVAYLSYFDRIVNGPDFSGPVGI